MEENRGKAKAVKTYGRIISTLTHLRQGRVDSDRITKKFAEIFSSEFKYSKVIGEVWDLPDSLIEVESGFSNLKL